MKPIFSKGDMVIGKSIDELTDIVYRFWPTDHDTNDEYLKDISYLCGKYFIISDEGRENYAHERVRIKLEGWPENLSHWNIFQEYFDLCNKGSDVTPIFGMAYYGGNADA